MIWPADRPLGKWFRGEKWGIAPLKEDTWEYANTMTTLDLNYQIVIQKHAGHELYDPMRDEPNLYLRFIRLAEFKEHPGAKFQGTEKDCINKILKFFQDYGPLWRLGGPVDYDRDSVQLMRPLTIVRVLYEAQDMASVVKIYKLLRDVEDLGKPVNELISSLKEHMRKLQDRLYGVKDHLVTTREGLRVPAHIYDNKTGEIRSPSLGNNKETIETAIAYVIAGVNEKLSENQIYLALANFEGRNQGQKDESQTGAWVPAYSYGSLLAVLWLQFYLAILNKTRLKVCANEECPRLKLFVPNRPKQEYCSDNCRVAQYMRENYRSNKQEKGQKGGNK